MKDPVFLLYQLYSTGAVFRYELPQRNGTDDLSYVSQGSSKTYGGLLEEAMEDNSRIWSF